MNPIDPDKSVNQIVREHPATVAVFNEFGIDACCGGASPLREAAERDGAPLTEVVAALERCVADAS